MTQATVHAALAFDCPFCKAIIGEPCRTRNSGREQTWPHSRRIARTTPPEERYVPTRLGALCCLCGHNRTVSSNHYTSCADPNSSHNEANCAKGWKYTRTLKCDACGKRTRHAILRGDGDHRDSDEQYQRYTLGGEWEGNPQYAPDRDRLREEYFATFPRNPNLHHRFYIEPATKAWDAGERTITALCGTPDSIETDPRTWGQSAAKKAAQERRGGYVVAEQLSDIEYTDIETGLEWVDMDCVDCCRVSNDLRRTKRRNQLELLLAYFAARPEDIGDEDVEGLLQTLSEMRERFEGTE